MVFPSPAGVGVIAVTKISFPSGLSFNVSKYSRLIFAMCRPIGLKAVLSSGTFIFANTSFIGCIFASRAIWISDLTSLIINPINNMLSLQTSYPFLSYLETSKKYI